MVDLILKVVPYPASMLTAAKNPFTKEQIADELNKIYHRKLELLDMNKRLRQSIRYQEYSKGQRELYDWYVKNYKTLRPPGNGVNVGVFIWYDNDNTVQYQVHNSDSYEYSDVVEGRVQIFEQIGHTS